MIATLYDILDRNPGAARWVGMLASGGATALSFLEQLEIVLRVVSLMVGILIGVVTLAISLRKWHEGRNVSEDDISDRPE